MKSYEQYIRDSAVPRQVIDDFLDTAKPSWARFDPETGYTLGNSLQHDGLDDCWTISTAGPNGERTARLYADRLCRINTYGDSFTQCHQASDGETWQEYLAAHLGEPIRNFGMGGFGVYQAYRRMRRIEQSSLGGKYVLFYLWGDDHQRSIMRCRHAVTYPFWKLSEGLPFHGNFWANVELDPRTGRFVEYENRLGTPADLFRMTDPDFMYQALKDDVMVQLNALGAGQFDPATVDYAPMNAVAKVLGLKAVNAQMPDFKEAIQNLRLAYGFAATKFVLEKTVAFCRDRGKNLLILLLCPTATRQLLCKEPRYDQEIADFIRARKLPCFDMNLVHLADFKAFNLSVADYLKRYFIGHYGPAGNHFFAYALKDTLVPMLDPKPIVYRDNAGGTIDFKGYLPE